MAGGIWGFGFYVFFASGCVITLEEDRVRQTPSEGAGLPEQQWEELVANNAAWPLDIWSCFWLGEKKKKVIYFF